MRRLSLDEAAVFHGHLGPFLALGYRAGEIVVEILKPSSFNELKAVVRCPLKTPYSCFIDGVQCSTCCTVGKRTLEIVEGDGITLEVEGPRGGRLRLKVREEAFSKIRSTNKLEEAARWVLDAPLEALFEIL